MALTKISTGMLKQDAASSDLNIDAGTLYLDVSNNRVGIANTSPTAPLTVQSQSNAVGVTLLGRTSDSIGELNFASSNGTNLSSIQSRSTDLRVKTLGTIPLTFHTVNTERMRIDSSGQVGIGLSSNIDRKLHVENDNDYAVKFGGTSAGDFAIEIGQSSTNGSPGFNATAGSMKFSMAGTEAMRIDSSGNLLVGKVSDSSAVSTDGINLRPGGYSTFTATSKEALQLSRQGTDGDILDFYKGSVSVGSIQTKSSDLAIGTGDTGIRFVDGDNALMPHSITSNDYRNAGIGLGTSNFKFTNLYLSNKVYAAYIGEAGDTDTSINFDTADTIKLVTGGTERMRIDSSGNVGIGTTSPSIQVDVENTVANSGGKLRLGTSDSSTSGVMGRLIFGNSNDIAQSIIEGLSDGATDASALVFKTEATGSSEAERMRIDSSGRVGIGTTDPSSGTSTYYDDLVIRNIASGTGAGITIQSNTTNGFGAVHFRKADGTEVGKLYASSGGGQLGLETSGSERMRIDSSGRVLINLTGPVASSSAKLQVSNTAAPVVMFNRTNSGDVITLHRDGTSATGTISVNSGYIGVGAGSVYLGFYTDGSNNKSIIPMGSSTGSAAAGSIGLGINNANHKFKDAWITGAVNAASLNIDGGTIKLDGNYPTGTANTALGNGTLDALTSGAYNVAVGDNSQTNTTTGQWNTSIGTNSLTTNTTGSGNTALGNWALKASTTSSYNTAVGQYSLQANTTGSNNVAVGRNAAGASTTATMTVAIGYEALVSQTTGGSGAGYNTAVGAVALASVTDNYYNTAVGYAAGNAYTSNGLTAVGWNSFGACTTGAANTGLGYRTGTATTTGASNTAVGHEALVANTTAPGNTAIGAYTLDANTTGEYNVGLGYQALTANTTGKRNTSLGAQTLYGNTTADYNVAIGFQSMLVNTTGANNTTLGSFTLYNNTTAGKHVAIGYNALNGNTTGDSNIGIGYAALDSNTTASHNIGIGRDALGANTTGTFNTAIGSYSLDANTVGSRNIAIGYNTLSAQNPTSATDMYNVAIGHSALAVNTTGYYNTAIGGLSLDGITTGFANTAVGLSSLTAATTGQRNTAMGYQSQFSTTTANYNTSYGADSLRLNTTGGNNTAIGTSALRNGTTGSMNVAVGLQALYNANASSNIAIGQNAMFSTTSGNNSVAVGHNALFANTTGAANAAFGYQALDGNTTGNYNTALGSNSLDGAGNASSNTAVGYGTLRGALTGSSNTAVGESALLVNTSGSVNVAVGAGALDANTTASYNTAIGTSAGTANTTGQFGTFVGRNAGAANTTADRNTFIGQSAGASNTTGASNTALGDNSFIYNTTGSNNTALGKDALFSNTTAVYNTAVGYQAGYTGTTTGANVYIGYQAGYANTGGNITVIGYRAGVNHTTASTLDAVGYQAAESNTTGNASVAFGFQSLTANTTGASNTSIGNQALYANTTGGSNVALGYQAGYSIQTGANATFIGTVAGRGTTAGNNTFVGNSAGYNVTSGAKNTILGRYNGNQGGLDIRTSSNYIVLSDGDGNPKLSINNNAEFRFNHNYALGSLANGASSGIEGVSIGTTTSSGTFKALVSASDAAATIYCAKSTSYTDNRFLQFYVNSGSAGSITYTGSGTAYNTASDYRLKENVVAMTGATERLKQLAPKRFNFIVDADTTVDGFLAHEVQSVVPEAIVGTHNEVDDDGNPVYQGIDQSKLVPLLVATIKELEARITALESQ